MSNITKVDDKALAALAGFEDDFFEDNTGSSTSFTTYTADLGGFTDENDNCVTDLTGYVVHTRKQVALWISKDAKQPALSSFFGQEWDKWDDQQLKDLKDPDAHTVPVDDSKYMQWNKDPNGKSYKGWHPDGVDFDKDLVKGAKETIVLYVLVAGLDIPVAVKVPASSFKGFKTYKKDLASKGGSLPKVQTKFTIERKSGNGNKWAVVNFELAGVCQSKEEWDAITTCAKLTKETLSGFSQKQDESNGGEDPPF